MLCYSAPGLLTSYYPGKSIAVRTFISHHLDSEEFQLFILFFICYCLIKSFMMADRTFHSYFSLCEQSSQTCTAVSFKPTILSYSYLPAWNSDKINKNKVFPNATGKQSNLFWIPKFSINCNILGFFLHLIRILYSSECKMCHFVIISGCCISWLANSFFIFIAVCQVFKLTEWQP